MQKYIHLILSYLILFTAIVFNPFGSNPFELIKTQYFIIIISTLIIILLLNFLMKGKLVLRVNKSVLIFLSIWGLSLIISTLFSIAPELSFWGSYSRFQGLLSHIHYIFLFLIFYQLFDNTKKIEVFLKALITIGLIVSLHAILQKFGILIFSQEAMNQFLNRSYSTFGHPNFLGQFLILPIFSSLYFISKSSNKILRFLFLLILIGGLFTTENRASILGVLFGIFLLTLINKKVKKSYKVILSIFLVCIFALFVTYFAPSSRSIMTRFYLWSNSLDLINNKNPLYFIVGFFLDFKNE